MAADPDRVELLERTTVILAAYFWDPDRTDRENAITQEQVIQLAKRQAMGEMQAWREKIERIRDAR